MATFAPDAVWNTGVGGGLMRVFVGREALRGFLEAWIRPFEDYEQVVEEFHDFGDGVTLHVNLARGRPIGSSGFVELRFATVATWSDGLIERFATYTDIDRARAAAERLAEERDS